MGKQSMENTQRQIFIDRIKLSTRGNWKTEILLNKTETKNIQHICKMFLESRGKMQMSFKFWERCRQIQKSENEDTV